MPSLPHSPSPSQNVTSAQWLPPRSGTTECMVVAGMGDGQIYMFKGGTCVKAIAAHRPGIKQVRRRPWMDLGHSPARPPTRLCPLITRSRSSLMGIPRTLA